MEKLNIMQEIFKVYITISDKETNIRINIMYCEGAAWVREEFNGFHTKSLYL